MKTKILIILMLVMLSFTTNFAQQTALKVGDKAPDFTLLNQNGKAVKLSANVVEIERKGADIRHCS
jgi:peroxiredoxin